MVKQISKLFRNNQFVRELKDDEDYVLQDGEMVQVRMNLMDSDPGIDVLGLGDAKPSSQPLIHRPGFAELSGPQIVSREVAYARRDRALCDAWKSPPSAVDVATTATASTTPKTPTTDRNASAYDRVAARLRDAWKSA